MSFGASFTGVTFFQAAPVVPVQGADNGNSLDGTNVVFGQDVGAPGNPARLLSDREIPMNTRRVQFIDTFNSTIISLFPAGSVQVEAPSASVSASSSSGMAFLSLFGSGTQAQILNNSHNISFFNAGGMTLNPNSTPADPGANNCQIEYSVGIGLVPTARLHIRAGQAGVGLAPFKYNSGVANQTVLENGAKNFNGTNEFLTAGGVNYTMAKTLTATAALDFPDTATQTSSDLTIALTGAAGGDVVLLGVPVASVNADTCYTAFVSAANTVTVRFNNYSAGSVNPASGTFRIAVVKY